MSLLVMDWDNYRSRRGQYSLLVTATSNFYQIVSPPSAALLSVTIPFLTPLWHLERPSDSTYSAVELILLHLQETGAKPSSTLFG